MNTSISIRDSEFWLFDLDNTLYPASNGLMADVSLRMTKFVSNKLNIPKDAALTEQKELYRKFGTTLSGLMKKYKVDPYDFLDFVHQVDYSLVQPDPRLARLLENFPGRKLVYTNASANHAEQVLKRLQIADHFEGIYDIVAAEWQPKPIQESYQTLIDKYNINPKSAVMIEDIAINLQPAALMGMTTVWINHLEENTPIWTMPSADSVYVHHKINNLNNWLNSLIL
jgi:putative hydrolase of the HAD superfamily